jgi:hypothetical protein
MWFASIFIAFVAGVFTQDLVFPSLVGELGQLPTKVVAGLGWMPFGLVLCPAFVVGMIGPSEHRAIRRFCMGLLVAILPVAMFLMAATSTKHPSPHFREAATSGAGHAWQFGMVGAATPVFLGWLVASIILWISARRAGERVRFRDALGEHLSPSVWVAALVLTLCGLLAAVIVTPTA